MDAILKLEFFRQYMEEIAELEGLTFEDCEYSWMVNKNLIHDLDDVDRIVSELVWFE